MGGGEWIRERGRMRDVPFDLLKGLDVAWIFGLVFWLVDGWVGEVGGREGREGGEDGK